MCRDFLSIISELMNFVTCSPKRLNLFQAFQLEDESVNLRKFCRTWWTFRASFFRSVVQNCSPLIMFLHDLASKEWNDAGVKCSGFSRTLWKFDTYFKFKHPDANTLAVRDSKCIVAEKMAKTVGERPSKLGRQWLSQFWNTSRCNVEQGRVY